MSAFYNHDEPKEPKVTTGNEEKLIKNQECVGCKNLFTCKGKPRSVKSCVNKQV